MDASPTLDSPRAGDPITADWAARVADAANAVPHTPQEPGAFASPFGSVPRQAPQTMLGPADRSMPFDVRLVWDAGTSKTHAYIFLPSLTSPAGAAYVFTDCAQVPMMLGVSTSNGWLDLGEVPAGSKRFVTFGFTAAGAGTAPGQFRHAWGVEMSANATAPSFANAAFPWLVVAMVYVPTGANTDPETYGVFQFHRGAIFVPHRWVRWNNYPASSPNFAFRDDVGNAMFSTSLSGGSYTLSGSWNFAADVDFGPGRLLFSGEAYAPQTITDGNGNSVEVLARVTP